MFLQSIKELFVVKTDYKNLINFLTTKELNKRQVRWAEMLAKYYFEIKHVKELNNSKTNILSRKKKLFKKIKNKFTKELILKIYQSELSTRVKIDALDFALRVCLLQKYSEVWHPVVYYNWKMILPKLNYDIYNKELLGIVVVLKE